MFEVLDDRNRCLSEFATCSEAIEYAEELKENEPEKGPYYVVETIVHYCSDDD